jgi:hypothetical protein
MLIDSTENVHVCERVKERESVCVWVRRRDRKNSVCACVSGGVSECECVSGREREKDRKTGGRVKEKDRESEYERLSWKEWERDRKTLRIIDKERARHMESRKTG